MEFVHLALFGRHDVWRRERDAGHGQFQGLLAAGRQRLGVFKTELAEDFVGVFAQ